MIWLSGRATGKITEGHGFKSHLELEIVFRVLCCFYQVGFFNLCQLLNGADCNLGEVKVETMLASSDPGVTQRPLQDLSKLTALLQRTSDFTHVAILLAVCLQHSY